MKTRTIAILGLSAVVLIGGMALGAASFADSRMGWRDGDSGYGHGGGHYGPMMGGGHGRGGMMGRLDRFMSQYDTNNDGKLTAQEIQAGRNARLAAFDADGDGTLSLSEYQALWLDAMRPRMVDRFQELDEDGDGRVTKQEFAQPYEHMVRFMDRNGDGAIGMDDMWSMHKNMHRDTDDRGKDD